MVIVQPYLSRVLRRLHYLAARDPIDELYRGWNWDRPPVRPRGLLGLTMGDVVYRYCPVRRDVWLRRVLGVRGRESRAMIIGRIMHTVFHAAYSGFLEASTRTSDPVGIYEYLIQTGRKRLSSMGVPGDDLGWSLKLYRRLALALSGSASMRMIWHPGSRGFEGMMWLTEHHVDGSMLGLSQNLRVDAYGDGIVVEIKYGRYMDFQRLALAGYALALEAEYEAPVNYGLLVHVNGLPEGEPSIRVRSYYIDTSMRQRFIEARDEVIDMLMSEREPPKPSRNQCPESCPFYHICWGGGGGV